MRKLLLVSMLLLVGCNTGVGITSVDKALPPPPDKPGEVKVYIERNLGELRMTKVTWAFCLSESGSIINAEGWTPVYTGYLWRVEYDPWDPNPPAGFCGIGILAPSDLQLLGPTYRYDHRVFYGQGDASFTPCVTKYPEHEEEKTMEPIYAFGPAVINHQMKMQIECRHPSVDNAGTRGYVSAFIVPK
jgi:hypothetical protein